MAKIDFETVKHLTRGKDRTTGAWVVGYYIGESGGEYNGAKVYGWHIEVLSATLPEWDDDDSEYPAYLKIQSILNIPSFKVVGNKWDN